MLRIQDCLPCHIHNGGAPGVGCNLADPIHNVHYSSGAFLALEGNCWSCHDIDDETGAIVLWDVEKYTPAGVDEMYTYTSLPQMSDWMKIRGCDNGRISEMALAPNIELADVRLDQDISDPGSVFTVANNLEPQISTDEYTLALTGVNEPRTFTYDELKAMPQTTILKSQMCPTSGDGGVLVDNIEMTGVLIATSSSCAAVWSRVPTVGWTGIGWDEWDGCFSADPTVLSLDSVWDDEAMIVLQYYGEDLTVAQGGPANLFVPGTPGIVSIKWVKEIGFCKDDAAMPAFRVQSNSGFFLPSRDGMTYRWGEPVQLEGYANCWDWGWSDLDSLTSIEISGDYGQTWTSIPIDLDDYDPEAWVHWTAAWNPPAPGTYNLSVRATCSNPDSTLRVGNVIVTIAE